MKTLTQPSIYIPHGGGPCFFMDDPQKKWAGMEKFLRLLSTQLPEPPKAILVVSAHWETDGFTFTAAPQPELLFDYYNFPPHTYELRYDAPGSPELAAQAADLLRGAGLKSGLDHQRGFDHGVFVPLLVAFPEQTIPVVEMSLDHSLDPALHIAAGKALAPLREQGVLILGSGMSFHNMRAYGDTRATPPSQEFDAWLNNAATQPGDQRAELLAQWSVSPSGRFSHPREEHLLPLMVNAGASDNAGRQIYGELVLETAISGFSFA